MTFFERNIAAIKIKRSDIAEALLKTPQGNAYKGSVTAKTGEPVPLFASGQALHSLYNPEREAERTQAEPAGFILFCGLGCGVQIKAFLNKNPRAFCALTESDYASFKQLLSLIDYTGLLSDNRLFLLPPCTESSFESELTQTYLPAVHGAFGCYILRPWKEHFKIQTATLSERINRALEKVRADFSVQVHFGKIWLRNIFFNLRLAGTIRPSYPQADTTRTALILGAGPSLEKGMIPILEKRRQYVLFCTDTAFPVLQAYGITPEFYIALDPQHISYLHTTGTIPKAVTGIFDLSANTAGARRFYENGNAFFFTAGRHPLIQTASAFSPFPQLNTGAGTVAVTAYHAAQALGFRHIECSGMDFAYTGGKAYARGTYLSKLYTNGAERISSGEHSFIRLMFRTEVYGRQTENGRTYGTPLLDSYRTAFEAEKNTAVRWQKNDFRTFPYKAFLTFFYRNIKDKDTGPHLSLLPSLAWCTAHRKVNFTAMELVSELISEYTGL